MHHRSKHSGDWRDSVADDGETLYLNCARVPRIEADGARRHHIALEVTAEGVHAETLFVDNDGQITSREPADGHG